MKTGILRVSVFFVFTTLIRLATLAQKIEIQGRWGSAWSTAVQIPRIAPGTQALPLAFANQTIRMVVRLTIAGERLRIRFSNEFGTTPLVIENAHIALVKENGSVVPRATRPPASAFLSRVFLFA